MQAGPLTWVSPFFLEEISMHFLKQASEALRDDTEPGGLLGLIDARGSMWTEHRTILCSQFRNSF